MLKNEWIERFITTLKTGYSRKNDTQEEIDDCAELAYHFSLTTDKDMAEFPERFANIIIYCDAVMG